MRVRAACGAAGSRGMPRLPASVRKPTGRRHPARRGRARARVAPAAPRASPPLLSDERRARSRSSVPPAHAPAGMRVRAAGGGAGSRGTAPNPGQRLAEGLVPPPLPESARCVSTAVCCAGSMRAVPAAIARIALRMSGDTVRAHGGFADAEVADV